MQRCARLQERDALYAGREAALSTRPESRVEAAWNRLPIPQAFLPAEAYIRAGAPRRIGRRAYRLGRPDPDAYDGR